MPSPPSSASPLIEANITPQNMSGEKPLAPSKRISPSLEPCAEEIAVCTASLEAERRTEMRKRRSRSQRERRQYLARVKICGNPTPIRERREDKPTGKSHFEILPGGKTDIPKEEKPLDLLELNGREGTRLSHFHHLFRSH